MAHSGESTPERTARNAADQLATALEEVGFDVGREFSGLRSALNLGNRPAVDVGRITAESAFTLARILTEAAGHGVGIARSNDG
jgi:hypothetical protein